MTDALRHRGPDARGHWMTDDRTVALGHRRLSILDLSPNGAQPMASASGRFVIAYNGEVYNHLGLRSQLPGVAWRGSSDTETVLAAIEAWGLEAAVKRFIGMFAIAVWDTDRRELSLVRDRLGIKPLYCGAVAGGLLFASEARCFTRCPGFDRSVCRRALQQMLRYNCVPGERSIYENAWRIQPGTVVRFRTAERSAAKASAYWSVGEAAREAAASPFEGSPEEAVEEAGALVEDAVRQRMLSDVPLGAFLSGGVDSSAIVALMQRAGGAPVKTYSVGFFDRERDEAKDAARVAKHLGCDHTEFYVTAQDAIDAVVRMPTVYDEPFADPSQAPTLIVCQLARKEVTVALSGDGGDEAFVGYNRHQWASRVWALRNRLPRTARRALGRTLRAASPESWDRWFSVAGRTLPTALRQRTPGEKIHKVANGLMAETPGDLYRLLRSHWTDPASALIDAPLLDDADTLGGEPRGLVDQFVYWDQMTYLPDDILTKVDRASMACSLEVRVPLLDHRVIELGWRLPLEYKLRGGVTKWVLRQVLYRHVPRELIERPKTGFAPPLGEWLRGPLREWCESLIDADRLRDEGYFHPAVVRAVWEEHLSGKRTMTDRLWPVLMFQAWLAEQPSP